jgi:hypothetical protein
MGWRLAHDQQVTESGTDMAQNANEIGQVAGGPLRLARLVRRMRLWPAIWLCVAGAAASGAAAQPVALILDAEGSVPAALEPFSEVEPGGEHTLDGSTTVRFLHYATCEEVAVRAGALGFSAQGYTARGGTILESKTAKCPKTFEAKGNANVGGAVMRSSGTLALRLRLAREPDLLIAGRGASAVRAIQFNCANGSKVEAKVTSPRFSWPQGAEGLPVGDCRLILLNSDGSVQAELDVSIADQGRRHEILIRTQ